MLRLTFITNEPMTALDREITSFVNRQIADEIRIKIDMMHDIGEEYDLSYYFPRQWENRPEDCRSVLYELYDTVDSSVLYDTDEIEPIQCYVLYHILDEWAELETYEPECVKIELPKELEEAIIKKYGPLDSEDEENDNGNPIMSMVSAASYIANIFEDTDFLEEDIRGFVQGAMGDPKRFLSAMDYEELDRYVDVMPRDVAARYLAFRAQLKIELERDPENAIVNAILSAIGTMQERVADHSRKGEVQLTADLDDMIKFGLADKYNILTKREYNAGRAKKELGECDLLFWKVENGRTENLAVLENKNIENFREQYYQLMGYLNPQIRFGITVSINRKYKLKEAREKIIEFLRATEGEFAATDIMISEKNYNLLMSQHIVPETGEKMRVHHFILNLEDEARQKAANRARRKRTKEERET